ncbi:flagellar export chaperone FlgN [Desulfovibrio litoralis]|uniref:FlgN protein n=1 Tax=Desulfovibrio litoralis DSM 11393 TaxID=1121455 RepID=A0A1M7TFH9_9BACT|nr:flagellar export chaperone FlgN [Desulfovibrio litoralis]SHN69423.1 FlgN protein [Desulfovibrio litoralis DSM 11393]
MNKQIYGILFRQYKALELLYELMQEEFTLLQERRSSEVSNLEFSIHELLRQIAGERLDLRNLLGDITLLDYANLLPEEEAEELRSLFHKIDKLEQTTARQATFNTEISLALLDQSQSMLSFLHDSFIPKNNTIYGDKGLVKEQRPEAVLFRGRL